MDGVTTAIVLFVFVCVLFPRLIDNRPQYYIALVLTLLLIVLQPVAFYTGNRGLPIGLGILQAAAVLLLFLSAGGLSVRGLTTEMMGAFEVIRRGETEKEVIIPMGDRSPRRSSRAERGEPAERIDLTADDKPAYPTSVNKARVKKSDEDEDGPIPMD